MKKISPILFVALLMGLSQIAGHICGNGVSPSQYTLRNMRNEA